MSNPWDKDNTIARQKSIREPDYKELRAKIAAMDAEYARGMKDSRGRLNDATPLEWDRAAKASDRQVGGNHYKDMVIQPLEFITANNLNFLEGNIIKYTLRHHAKGGAEDVRKVIHYAELLLEHTYGEAP